MFIFNSKFKKTSKNHVCVSSGAFKRKSGKTVVRFTALLLCIALSALLTAPFAVYSKEEPKAVRVGWFESPFNQTDKFGRRSGYAYEYQQKIAAYTGWTYEYVAGSWPDLMQMLINGEIDLLSDVSFTEERAEKILYPSVPIGAEEYYLFIEPSVSEYTNGNYDYFQGKKIGVNKGSVQAGFLENWLKTYDIDADIIELTCQNTEAFEMMKNGELDGYVALDAYGSAGTAVPEIRIGSSDFYFAVSKGRTDLLKSLDAALIKIQDENRYYNQQLSQKYINSSGANLFISEEEKAWLESHGTIRIGYQDNYLAFCAKDAHTGELTGALKDYLGFASDCLANARLNFEAIPYPNADAAVKALKNGEIDCMFPSNLSASDGEKLDLIMTPPIINAEVYALVRRSEQYSFMQKADITVAVETGEPNYEALLMDHFPDWQKEYFADMWICLGAVSDGRADCFLISNYQYSHLARQCEKYGLAAVNTDKDEDFCFAVGRGSKELYSILTRTTAVVSSANVNAALAYYSAEDAKTGLIDLIRDNLAVVILAAVAIVAMILLLIFQRRIIVAQRKANESQRMVEDLNKKVFTDALTHVKNKGGFDNYIKQMQEKTDRNEVTEIAIGVFDCNDLKLINDRFGHEKGNQYLKTACSLICGIFAHSPVFRIGGDEFTVVLLNDDFQNRKELIKRLEDEQKKINSSAENPWESVSVASGVADYDPHKDGSLSDTFHRADQLMYENKRAVKSAETNAGSAR